MKRFIMALSVIVLFSSSAAADIIIFRSGSGKEGIIVEETPISVKMRIKKAVIGFSRSNIERIEYASPEENRKLDQKWMEQEKGREEKRKRKREEKERFEKGQREKGLVKAGDQWVTRRQKAELEQEEIRGKIEARKAERAAQQRALAAEEEEETEESEIAKDIKKIAVDSIGIKLSAGDVAILNGRLTNKGEFTAANIFLEILIYDKEGRPIFSRFEKISSLEPNQSRKLKIPLGIEGRFVGSSKVRVISVLWKPF